MTVQTRLIDQTVRQFNMEISKRHQIFYAEKSNRIKSNNKSFIFNILKKYL